MRQPLAAPVLAVAVLALAASANGQCETQQLLASDGNGGDWFGFSIAASGDRVVVGAEYAQALYPDSSTETGNVYLFETIDGVLVETAILVHDEIGTSDLYGASVAIDGTIVVAGAPVFDQPFATCGAAFVFEKISGAWTQTARLNAADAGAGDQYGDEDSVSISGETIVVGAWRHNGAFTDSGAAFVYERGDGSWPQTQKLEASDAAQTDWFGGAVWIDGDVIVVGARRDDDLGDRSGSAYVFERTETGWIETAKLLPSDGIAEDEFGDSVAVHDGVIVVGVPHHAGVAGSNSGAVYVYEKVAGVWTQTAKLEDSDGDPGDRFGEGVAVRGDRILVGAWFDGPQGDKNGAMVVFDRFGPDWIQTAKLTASDGGNLDKLGRCVAIGDTFVAGGAYWDDDQFSDSGSAYIFTDVETPDCDGNGQFDGCDMRLGLSFDCDGNGLPDVCDITVGTSDDCDGDTVPDHCQTHESYAIDGGTANENIFADEGYEFVWLNAFTVAPGGEVITAIGNTWLDHLDGEPVTYLVYADPNDDGDPADAVLLGTFPGETREMNYWESDVTLIDPTYVGEAGERYFIGAWYTQHIWIAASIDIWPPYQAESWITIADSGAVDLEALSNNTFLPPSRIGDVCTGCGAGGNWMLRAHTAAVGPCDCPGDANGDQTVNVDDIVEVILNFNNTGIPGLPGDTTHNGAVTIDDIVKVVLNFNTTCTP